MDPESTRTSQLIVGPGRSGPPENELPCVLATPELIWRGDGIAVAVPSLQVYSTGVELQILGRFTPHSQTLNDGRAVADALKGLTVSGRAAGLLGGQTTPGGFTYRGWRAVRPGEAGWGLVLTLEWPGIAPAEHQVPAAAISDAITRVKQLWPAQPAQ